MVALRNIDSPERGVVILDLDCRVTFANKRASVIFGKSLDELIGDAMPEAVAARLADARLEDIQEEVIEGGLGLDAILHRYSTPVYSSDGSVAGRVEIYSDITARRELEHEILASNRELADLNVQLEEAQEQLVQSERLRALGEMAAGVAHDINNALGIIIGNAQLVKRKLDPDSKVLKSIDGIELAAKDAAETVRRLREIGKPIDTSSYQSLDLSEIVDDVVRAAVPAWRESGSHGGAEISVETNLARNCFIKGNATELREALANILLNSVLAIKTSGKILISTKCGDSFTDLTVVDTGIGMNEETKKRLLDPFFTTRGAEGTGLGISMVDAIAIRHRGKLIVESEEGAGTSVTIRFPSQYDCG